jgi:hypothetical protein
MIFIISCIDTAVLEGYWARGRDGCGQTGDRGCPWAEIENKPVGNEVLDS